MTLNSHRKRCYSRTYNDSTGAHAENGVTVTRRMVSQSHGEWQHSLSHDIMEDKKLGALGGHNNNCRRFNRMENVLDYSFSYSSVVVISISYIFHRIGFQALFVVENKYSNCIVNVVR